MAPALLLALCALAVAGRAGATTLRLGPSVSVSQSYSSNVYASEDEASDLFTTVAPKLTLAYASERGSVSAELEGRGKQYWDQTNLDAFDRSAHLQLGYLLTPRLSLSSWTRYDYLENTDDYDIGGGLIAGEPDTEYLNWSATGRYALDSRTSLSLTPNFWRAEISDQELPYCTIGGVRVPGALPPCPYVQGPTIDGVFTRIKSQQPVVQASESRMFGGRLGFDRSLSARDTASFSFGQSLREFEGGASEGNTTSDRDNDVQSGLVGWAREWTPRWSTRITLGVERVQNDTQAIDIRQYGFEPVPGGATTLPAFDDTTLIGSGTLGLDYKGNRSTFSLSYSQQSYPSVSYGSSLNAQTVRASLSHRVNRRLSLDLGGYYTHESTIGDVVDILDVAPSSVTVTDDPENPGTDLISERAACGSSSVEFVESDDFALVDGEVAHVVRTDCLGFTSTSRSQDYYSVAATVNWQMTRRFSTFLRYSWFQRSAGGDTRVPEYDKNVVTLGFKYGYDIDLY
jgi:hypothetical protein